MNLSEHFTLKEMTITTQELSNFPDEIHVKALMQLCVNILEPIRTHFSCPVIVTSGYRCAAVNRATGGEEDSQHVKGEAADIHVPSIDNCDVWQYIVDSLPFDQVIAEKLSNADGQAGWIHVSFVSDGRRDAISFLGHGKYVKGLEFLS